MEKTILLLLQNLEKTQKKYWNISRETAEFLNILIKERKYKTVLEIGTSSGYSAIWIATALKENKGHLYTIESHKKERFLIGKENIEASGLTNITQILGHAPECIPENPKSLDMAFFDATKEEYIQYFNTIKNKIKKGGIIVADNITSHKEAVKPYIDAVKNEPGWVCETINIGTGLLISYKI